MTAIYLLIILWFLAGSQSGKAIDHIEFHDQKSCEFARQQVLMQEGTASGLLRAVCVPKQL